jgi:hypothetical protein
MMMMASLAVAGKFWLVRMLLGFDDETTAASEVAEVVVVDELTSILMATINHEVRLGLLEVFNMVFI